MKKILFIGFVLLLMLSGCSERGQTCYGGCVEDYGCYVSWGSGKVICQNYYEKGEEVKRLCLERCHPDL